MNIMGITHKEMYLLFPVIEKWKECNTKFLFAYILGLRITDIS